jgi:glutathione S-transferase
MEKTLQEGDWLIGEQYSLADVAMTPYVNRLDMIKLYELFMKDRPHVHAWFQRIKSMPNFEPAINKWMPQNLIDDFSNFGQQSVSHAKRVLESI